MTSFTTFELPPMPVSALSLATPTAYSRIATDPDGRRGDNHPNFVHCPSETTSTEPSTTLMAVCSSMA
jgi:hypothetical protein